MFFLTNISRISNCYVDHADVLAYHSPVYALADVVGVSVNKAINVSMKWRLTTKMKEYGKF